MPKKITAVFIALEETKGTDCYLQKQEDFMMYIQNDETVYILCFMIKETKCNFSVLSKVCKITQKLNMKNWK